MRIAIATFAGEGSFLRARARALAAERRILGEWTPYAAVSLSEGEGARGVVAGVVLAGLAGGIGLFALTVWSVYAYRFNQGNRGLFSWPAFVPSPVEFGALTAAIGGAVMLIVRGGLTRLHHPAFDLDEVAEASLGRFVLALACDAGEDGNAAVALLATEALHSRLVEP